MLTNCQPDSATPFSDRGGVDSYASTTRAFLPEPAIRSQTVTGKGNSSRQRTRCWSGDHWNRWYIPWSATRTPL